MWVRVGIVVVTVVFITAKMEIWHNVMRCSRVYVLTMVALIRLFYGVNVPDPMYYLSPESGLNYKIPDLTTTDI